MDTKFGMGALALLAGFATPLAAQTGMNRMIPTNQFMVTGYGTVGYGVLTQGTNENSFNSSMNPIFLFQFQDRVLFEAEFEFAFEGGVTETGLEYAQVDFLLNDNITLVGGKFLVPFGVFGDRLHPTWINKFATAPPIYGHHVASFGADPLMPVITDIGVMAKGGWTLGDLNVGVNAYAVQGPVAEDPTAAIPELGFPASSEDSNKDKMFGTRFDIALPPWFEINVSYLSGDYDDQNVLDMTGWNFAGEFRYRHFEARGEYIIVNQEIEVPSGFPVFQRTGMYVQGAYRMNRFEPVLRWTQVFSSTLDGVFQEEGAWQAGLGLNYWFSPSIAAMGGYELNREKGIELPNDRLVLHIAYGF